MILISNVRKGNASRVNINIVLGSEPQVVLPLVLGIPRMR